MKLWASCGHVSLEDRSVSVLFAGFLGLFSRFGAAHLSPVGVRGASSMAVAPPYLDVGGAIRVSGAIRAGHFPIAAHWRSRAAMAKGCGEIQVNCVGCAEGVPAKRLQTMRQACSATRGRAVTFSYRGSGTQLR